MQKNHLDERVNWAKLGSSVWNAAKPMVKDAGLEAAKKAGKKVFRKAAKTAIKHIGKDGTKKAWSAVKTVAANPAVQQAAKEAGSEALQWGTEKIKNAIAKKKKPEQQPSQEELVESFSRRVELALANEAIDPVSNLAKAGVGYGAGKVMDAADGDLSNLAKAETWKKAAKSVGKDAVETAKDLSQLHPAAQVKNALFDDNGKFDPSLTRGFKKAVPGLKKAARIGDAALTGGIGGMVYDTIAGDDETAEQPEVGTTDQEQNQEQGQVKQQPVQAQPVQQSQQIAPEQQDTTEQQVQQPTQQVQQPAQTAQSIKRPIKRRVVKPATTAQPTTNVTQPVQQ